MSSLPSAWRVERQPVREPTHRWWSGSWRVLLALGGVALSPSAPGLETKVVATGLNQPVFLTAPTGDSRLFVVERGGIIKILENGVPLATPFLNISSQVNTTGERGLLGMAFDPNYAVNGRFYVNYIDSTTLNTVVATYQTSSNRNVALASSRQTVITIEQPAGQNNHKAGWIGFRPGEGNNLYIATGDGGSANDPQNRAQDLNSNLGKMLRVDVSTDRAPQDSGQYGYIVPAGNPFAGGGGNPGDLRVRIAQSLSQQFR